MINFIHKTVLTALIIFLMLCLSGIVPNNSVVLVLMVLAVASRVLLEIENNQ